MDVHVGTSGWSYAHWDGVLYSPGTPGRDRLGHYVRRFSTVELDPERPVRRLPGEVRLANRQRLRPRRVD